MPIPDEVVADEAPATIHWLVHAPPTLFKAVPDNPKIRGAFADGVVSPTESVPVPSSLIIS